MDLTSKGITTPPDKPGYIISLDKYDFNYLHTYDRSTVVPLWTLQGPEYMEFQVYAEEIPSDPDGEKLDSRRCHICEVDVPVSYLEAHNMSTKHQLHSAIVQTSLDRLRKQQAAGDFSLVQSCAPLPSTYYCDSCAVAVDRSNKDVHEATNEHVNGKNRDDNLKKLMLIYQNPNYVENFCEGFKINAKMEDAVKQNKLDWRDEVFLYPKIVNPMTAHKIHYIDDYTVEISAKSGGKLAVAFDDFHGFCEDAGKIFCYVCRIPVNDKYKHIIDYGHIKQVTAPIEDKDCIRQVDQILSHCILCNENIENRKAHVLNKKHETALFNALITDEVYECMRKDFDQYDTNININQDWWEDVFLYPKKVNRMTPHKIHYIDDHNIEITAKSGAKVAVGFKNFHGFYMDGEDAGNTLCRVCRVLVEDKYKHINDDGHIKKITAPIGDKHCIRQLNLILNHCILCNEIIENSEFHISTEKHKTALKASILDVTSEVKKALADNFMAVSAFDKELYICNVCQIYVEHNNLEQHIDLDYHIESLSNATKSKDSKLRKKQAATEHCDICNMFIHRSKRKMKEHKKTLDHRYLAWLAQKDKKLHHHLSKIHLVKNATCKVCKVLIDADKPAMDEHIASSEHETEHKMLLQMNKMQVVDEKYILCNSCETLILTFEDLSHTTQKVHRKNLAKNETSLNSTKGEYTEGNLLANVSAQNDPDKAILTQNYLETKGDKCYCKVCDKTMELKDLNVHINCEWHVKNIASKLSEIKEPVIKKEDSYQIVTDQNNFEVPVNTPTHVHQNQNEDVYIGNYCTVCKVSISGREKGRKSHHIFSDHRYQIYLDEMDKGTRYHYHMELSSENKVICKVCKIEIKLNNISIQKHIESDKHCAKYEMLTNNLLIKINDARVLCTLCNVSLLILDDINHLTTKRHLKNLNTHGYRLKSPNPETYTSCSDTSVELENISEEFLQDNNLIKTGLEYYCQACYVGVEYNIVNIHVDSDLHRINLNKKQLVALKDSAKPVRKPEPLHYMYMLNEDSVDVKCKFCNVGVNFDCMAQHRKGNSHKQNVRDILHLNTITRIHYLSFCECCREIVNKNLEYEHLTSKKHVRNLSSMNGRMDTEEVLEIVESMLREYDATYSRNKSIKLLPKPSDENSDHSSSEESIDDEFPKSTIACNSALNIGSDEAENCESESSYASAKTSITENKQSSNTEIISNHEIKSDNLTSYLTSDFAHLFSKDNLRPLICQICDCSVSSRYDLFMGHVQSMKHTTKYESFLLANDIKESVDSEKATIRQYHCFTCGIDLPNSHLIPHITNESHKINLVNTQPSSSGQLKRDLEIVSKIHRTYFMEEGDGDVFCRLCDSEVQLKDIVKHIQNSVHQANIEAVLHENETRKVGHLIVCGLCKMGVKEGNEIEHIYSESHKNKIKLFPVLKTKFVKQNVTLSQGYLCGVCNVEILGNENVIKLHNEGNWHTRNMLKSAKATAQSSFNTLVQYVQPQEGLQIKTYTLCEICNIKYEDNLDDKRKHEGTLFHRTCQDFLTQTSNDVKPPDTKDTKTEPQIIDCSNNMTFCNFIADVPMYYWCENYDKDPFYLMSTVLKQSKRPTVVQNQSSESSHTISSTEHTSHVVNGFCTVCKVTVPTRSVNIAEHVKGARHKENVALADCSNNMTFFNFIPDVPIYYWCENDDKDPFYLMSTVLKKSKGPTIVQNQSSDSSHTTSSIEHTSHVVNGFCTVCKVTVPTRSVNIVEHVKGARHKKNVAIADCSNNMTFFNFIPDVPMYYWCENYDKDPFYLMSTVLKKSKGPTVVQNQSSESKNYITQSKSEENIDSRTSCSAPVPPASLDEHLLGAMHRQNGAIDDVAEEEKNETAKQITEPNFQENVLVFNLFPDVPISYWCKNDHKDPFYSMSVVSKNLKWPTVVQNQSNETKHQITQPKSQENIDSKYLANYYCSICSAKVAAANVFQHVLGARHNENVATKGPAIVKKIETAKQITQPKSQENIDAKYIVNGYCYICSATVAPANAAAHLTGARHGENVAIAEKSITNINTDYSIEHTNHIINDFCTVCKVRLSCGPANIALHVKGARHNENVSIAKKSKTTCHTTSSTEHTSHVVNGFCTVCKVTVPTGSVNIAEHVKGARHKENVEKTKTTSNTISGTEHTSHVVNGFCTVCKITVPTGSVNIAIHVKGARHKENVEKTKTTSKTISSTEHTSHVVNGFCTVCKVTVPTGSVNIAEHVKGARHKENVEKTKTTSKTISTTEHTSHIVDGFCTVCKVTVPTRSVNIAEHVKGARHKENVAVTKKNKATSNTISSTEHISHVVNGFCTVCKVRLSCGTANIALHVKGARHNENVSIAEKSKTTCHTTSSTEHASHVVNGFCTVCKVTVPAGSVNIAEHVKGARHKENVASTENNKRTSNTISSTEYTSHVVNGFCTVCKVTVPTRSVNIAEHVKGARHKENVAVTKKNKATSNTISSTEHISHVVNGFCTVCKVRLSCGTANIALHVKGARHNENVSIAEKSKTTCHTTSSTEHASHVVNGFCTVCKVTVPAGSVNIAEHVKGARHKENVASTENNKRTSNTISSTEYTSHVVNGFCTVCKVTVPTGSVNIAIHTKGARHQENVAIIEKTETTSNTSSSTEHKSHVVNGFCTVCNVKNICKGSVAEHVKGACHKSNVAITSDAENTSDVDRFCTVCTVNVSGPIANTVLHVKEDNHKENLTVTEKIKISKEIVVPTKSRREKYKAIYRVIPQTKKEQLCTLCNTIVLNTIESLDKHLVSATHKKYSENSLCNSATVSTSSDTTQANSRESSANRQSNGQKTKYIHSQICNVTLRNYPPDIAEDLAGTKYLKNAVKLNINTIPIDMKPENEARMNFNVQSSSFTKAAELYTPAKTAEKKTNSLASNDLNTNRPSTRFTNNIKTAQLDPASSEIDKDAVSEHDDDGFYICKICNVLIENNQTDIQSHLNSFRHNNKVDEMREKLKEDSQDAKLYYCEVCKCKITDNPITIKTHNESALHKKRFDHLLAINKIKIRDNKVCYCDLCDLYFNKFSVLSHIVKDKHKMLIGEAKHSSAVD